MRAVDHHREYAFTLVELLVVVAIIAILAALLLPALSSARQKGARAVCLSNLHQIGITIHNYAADNEGKIPYGPKAPPFVSPADLYPSTGAPTSLISLQSGAPVGLGLLLQQHLGSQPKVLFCPGADQPVDAGAELAKVGATQAQGSYYYRHAGNTNLFDNAGVTTTPNHIRLDDLGNNRSGAPIRALALDTIFLCPPDLETFNVRPRTNHRQQSANILFADGHTVSRPNTDSRWTVNLQDPSQLRAAFDRILSVLEQADLEP
jgi:prepilin-type N-terminal cleavage/methylation domain-containing protein/prepilin-type processing-associated H-X9-DG protein